MNVLVTGSSGFIGGHLYDQLARCGHVPIPMDICAGSPTTDLDGLLRTIDYYDVELIAHLGASCSTQVSLRDPVGDFHDNAVGTVHVCEAARRAGGIPVIYTSTVKVYPGADGRVAPLGQSKRVGEDYLRLYRDLYGLPSVTLRPSTVYGPGQTGSAEAGWVTWFLKAFFTGQPIIIHGDGTQSRDVLHIDDMTRLLVDIAEHFADYERRDPYDVGGGPANEVSLLGLLSVLEHETGTRHPVTHDEPLPGDLHRVVTDNTSISGVRGWTPKVSWADGVRDTLDWLGRRP
ncbi:NAD-dependent epimerase/dehydratase family protein [Streptomyces longwoodensis]|uniref:NAD-dependent epimerase/dehydratase family protein n=1 Tax=Streptomyces longwoodensis TaxID=68231 RepID=UPI002DDB828D|nr:NAD-dependent epimerase/dehydratase family protein [Streptomyces longwoodensis]WRY87416.1 NAD-dependent epimerase/dehydratase family protein [Streptomyces longwoodensis]